MTHVVHMTTVHPPGDTRIFVKEARALSDHGYDVTILYCQDDSRPPPDHPAIRFVALKQPRSRLSRMLLSVPRLLIRAIKLKAAVYHFHDPELIPAGVLLRLFGKKVIYDVHEDYREAFTYKRWVPAPLRGFIARGIRIVERLATPFMAAIVVATPRIALNFRHKRVVVARNFPRLSEFDVPDSGDYGTRKPVVVYVGLISEERSAFEMVDAMAIVGAEIDGATLLLGGKFASSALEEQVRARPGWQYVEFLGWQTRNQLVAALGKARVGLIVFHPVGNYTEALSVKMFEYMASGIPAVVADFPINRELSEGGEFGLLVEPKSAETLAGAITALLRDTSRARELGSRGQHLVQSEFNWEVEQRSLVALYDALTADRPTPPRP